MEALSQRSSVHFLHKVKDFPACPDTVVVDVLLLASDRREKRKEPHRGEPI